MKMRTLIFMMLALLVLGSCKKKIWGCMDETALNYSSVATEDSKDCMYPEEEEVIVGSIVTNVSWSQWGNTWGITVDSPSITQDVLDNGAVNVYMRSTGDSEWLSIPFSTYSGYTNVTTSIYTVYYLGGFDLIVEDDDGFLPDNPGNVDIKKIILQ